jgi:3-dehydroquinate synthase
VTSSRDIAVLSYHVQVQPGLLKDIGALASRLTPGHTFALVTDEHVAERWLEPVLKSFEHAAPWARVLSYAITPGEAQKTRDTWAAVTDWLLRHRCSRDTTVIALGGGVVGDLAGFVAATFLRGVPVIQVPTSLLAMVDSSVGGKTGVDTSAGKNLVGAFHQPLAVLIDPNTLATLPAVHARAGMAEVLKHGAIADATHFEAAERFGTALRQATERGLAVHWHEAEAINLIARSVAIKAEIVARDERESGLRKVLNAGHTVAHAVELVSAYRWLHGEAVSVGLVIETRLAEQAGIAVRGTARRLQRALDAVALPTALPSDLPVDALIQAMRSDKKASAGELAFSLLADIGRTFGDERLGWAMVLEEDAVRAELARAQGPPYEQTADKPPIAGPRA